MTAKQQIAHLDARRYRPVSIDWREDAVCLEEDDTLFFHPEGERGSPRRRRAEAAKAICRRCPVAVRCLEDAVRTDERNAVRGLFDLSDPAERKRAHALVKTREKPAPPKACSRCKGAMYERGTPKEKRPDGSKRHTARGLCSTCYVKVPGQRADAGRQVAA